MFSEICKASYFHIRALRHIRSSLTTEAAKTVAVAIVSSRLDYCNSLLAGTSASNLARLQLVQNTLARVVAQKSRYYHITPVLAGLHWLPVRHRNQFQNCHNRFQGTAPPAAFVPCSDSSKVHTFTITPVFLFYNHICTIEENINGHFKIFFIHSIPGLE